MKEKLIPFHLKEMRNVSKYQSVINGVTYEAIPLASIMLME